MKILVESSKDFSEMNEILEELIQKSVEMVIEEEGISSECEVNIFLVDNEEIREVNLEQRNVDKPTDVLSFPMTNMMEGVLEDWSSDRNPETGLLMLGDILVSIPKAVEQANEYGHSFRRELIFLITHGMYHLLGYDHTTEEEESKMIGKQEEILRRMSLQRG